MSIDDIKALASVIQSLVIAIAIIIGGSWALYRFFSLRTIDKAKADLLKVKSELDKRGILEIDIETTFVKNNVGTSGFLIAQIIINNCGENEEIIDWKQSNVRAELIRHDGISPPTREEAAIDGYQYKINLKPNAIVISKHQTKKFTFIIPIEKPGLYLIDAQLKGSSKETLAHKESMQHTGLEAAEHILWSTAVYFNVMNLKNTNEENA